MSVDKGENFLGIGSGGHEGSVMENASGGINLSQADFDAFTPSMVSSENSFNNNNPSVNEDITFTACNLPQSSSGAEQFDLQPSEDEDIFGDGFWNFDSTYALLPVDYNEHLSEYTPIPSNQDNIEDMNIISSTSQSPSHLLSPPPGPPASLPAHSQSLTSTRPFQCNFPGCIKGYKRTHELRRHQRIHSGIRNYACRFSTCDLAGLHGFVRKDHLMQHMRQVHGVSS